MAFNAADWTYDWVNKTVTNDDSGVGTNLPSAFGDNTYVGTVLDLFKDLATKAALSGNMDNYYPMESQTPTVYQWLNGWTFGHADDYKYLEGGSLYDPVADTLWSNAYTIGSQTTGTQIYLIQNDSEVAPWWITGNVDILIEVKTTGSWIQSEDTGGTLTDGGIWFYAREFGDLFDHNFGDLSGGGSNPIGINTAIDGTNASSELYLTPAATTGYAVGEFVEGGTSGAVGKIRTINAGNLYLDAVRGGTFVISETLNSYTDRELQTAGGGSSTNDGTTAFTNVVAGYTDITDTFGAISRDLNNGNGSQSYDAEVDCAGRPMSETYEWLKYITRYGSTGGTYTVNGDDGQEYRSADEGVYSEVKIAPFGSLAGSTFYGARGIWVTNYSIADFVLIDAANVEQSPPNYQKVDVNHVNLSGCNIFVAEISGGEVVKNQYTVDTVSTNTIDATLSLDINKVPQTGTIKAGTDTDVEYAYTGYSGVQFTGVTPDPTGLTGVFYVPLLAVTADATQELSDNIIYSADIDVRTSVRKYGFKPYDVDTTFGSSGLAFSPILSTDPQAT